MSERAVTLAPAAFHRRAVNHWIVAIIVVVPTFMEILDTSIANVGAVRTSPAGCPAPGPTPTG